MLVDSACSSPVMMQDFIGFPSRIRQPPEVPQGSTAHYLAFVAVHASLLSGQGMVSGLCGQLLQYDDSSGDI